MRKSVYVFVALLLLTVASCDKTPKHNILRIGYTEFSFDQAVVQVLKGILDQQPNLEVELYRVPDSTMFNALASNELDIGISAWLPHTHHAYFDKYPFEIKVHSLLCDSIGLYMAVPEYANLENIEDLKDVARILRNTIFIPESQNAIFQLGSDVLEDYDLHEFTLQESTWDSIMTFVDDSIKNNIGFAFITLRPHHSFRKYNLKALKDSRGSLGHPEQAFIVVNSTFNERMPLIADFLAQVRFDFDDIESIMEMNQVLGSEPYENALRWINQNTRRINNWLLGN